MLLGPGVVVNELDAFHFRHLLARVLHPIRLRVAILLVLKIVDTAPIIELQSATVLPVPQACSRWCASQAKSHNVIAHILSKFAPKRRLRIHIAGCRHHRQKQLPDVGQPCANRRKHPSVRAITGSIQDIPAPWAPEECDSLGHAYGKLISNLLAFCRLIGMLLRILLHPLLMCFTPLFYLPGQHFLFLHRQRRDPALLLQHFGVANHGQLMLSQCVVLDQLLEHWAVVDFAHCRYHHSPDKCLMSLFLRTRCRRCSSSSMIITITAVTIAWRAAPPTRWSSTADAGASAAPGASRVVPPSIGLRTRTRNHTNYGSFATMSPTRISPLAEHANKIVHVVCSRTDCAFCSR